MATRTANNKTYYINPAYLTFVENSGYGANLIQVSASSSCYISVYDPANGIDYRSADKEYQRWKVTAYNNKFPDDDVKYPGWRGKWHIYVQLEVKGTSALVIYDQVLRGVHGGEIIDKDDGQGNIIKVEGEYDPNHTYYYIHIGEVGETDGTSIRSITYDTGYLESPKGQQDAGSLNDMWRLNKYATPPLIEAQQWLGSFSMKGNLSFRNGESERPVNDVATAADKENEEAINDTTIATTAWVSEKFSEISDDKYLRKDQPDRTPYDLAVGGVLSTETSILFQNKQISGFIRKYDDPRPEVVTDTDFYSALMTDERIEEELRNLDDRYLRKDPSDIPDTAHRYINFEKGIRVYELATMMDLKVTDLARIAKAFVTQIGSEEFVDGFFGEGYQIWKAIATGDWNFTIDRLTVRKTMTVFELIIQKIRSVGGMVVVSAGNGKVKEVVAEGLEYRFTFEDENTFVENDLMRCQVWTGSGVKSYWVEVTRVDGENVYARIADFGDTVPEEGDEVVLMGNTQNPLRQGLVLISAAEDGQPRVDVLDGVKTTNFDDCLKARMGGLDGITDSRFPADMQPQGYGLYSNNCYLTGVFVLSTGVDVQTQFSIMEGQIRANMSSVQQQINAEDNYLSNASFTSDLETWEYENNVKIFDTAGGLLHFNGEYYSDKRQFAGIVVEDGKNVLRLKNSYIKQLNADFSEHPEFGLVEQKTTDEEGKEVGTGVMLYHPTMFFISFKYFVARRGTLEVHFEGEETKEDFEAYEPIKVSKVLDTNAGFEVMEIAGKWNGTGDFYLSFDGDIFIYDLALANNALADMEERWSMQLEITEKKIQANAEHIIQQGEDLEAYRSEFLYTAEQLRTEFTTEIKNTKDDITESYTGLVTQTAQTLESDYNAKFGDYYGKVTEEYNSKITQTAKDVTTELSARIDATDKAVGDLEVGLKADYDAKISASAQSLSSDYNAQITNLKTGDIATMKSSITQNANQIALKASQSNVDALTGRVTQAEAKFDLYVLETELGDLVSKIEISADQIDLDGVVTYQMLNNSLQGTIDGKAEDSELTAVQNSLNNSIASLNSTIRSLQTEVDNKASATSLQNKVDELNAALKDKADSDLTNAVIGGSTLIAGGYINTDVIDVENLVVQKLKAVNTGYTYSLDANGFVIKDSDNVELSRFFVSDYQSKLTMKKGDVEMELTPAGINFSYLTSTYMTASGITLNGSTISNLAIGTFGYNSMSSLSDFHRVSSDTSLPAARNNAGRIVFMKTSGKVTISSEGGSDIKKWDSYNAVSSVDVEGAWSMIFVSDGSYWYGFNCH